MEWVPGRPPAVRKEPELLADRATVPRRRARQRSSKRPAGAWSSQLEAGAVDMIRSLPLVDYIRLKSQSRSIRPSCIPNPGTYYVIGFNTLNPPLDNKKVRQAFNYALDRQRFVDQRHLWRRHAAVAACGCQGRRPTRRPKTTCYPFDLDKARALLARGRRLVSSKWTVCSPTSAEGDIASQIYQARPGQARRQAEHQSAGERRRGWTRSTTASTTGGYWSPGLIWSTLAGDDLRRNQGLGPVQQQRGLQERLVRSARHRAGTEVDPAKQKQIYSQLNDLVLDESFVAIASTTPQIMMTTAKVHGLAPTYHASFSFTGAWLEA